MGARQSKSLGGQGEEAVPGFDTADGARKHACLVAAQRALCGLEQACRMSRVSIIDVDHSLDKLIKPGRGDVGARRETLRDFSLSSRMHHVCQEEVLAPHHPLFRLDVWVKQLALHVH